MQFSHHHLLKRQFTLCNAVTDWLNNHLVVDTRVYYEVLFFSDVGLCVGFYANTVKFFITTDL